MRSSIVPIRVSRLRCRYPFLMRHTLRAALVKTRATGCFRFALHQPLQHELPKLPQKVPVRVLLSQLEQSILSSVIVVNLRGSGRLDNNHSTETHGGHSHRLRLHHFRGRYPGNNVAHERKDPAVQ